MVNGTLKTTEACRNPPLAPLYPTTRIEFSDVEALRVSYYTSADAVKHLIPEELDLSDEPLVTCSLLNWGVSPFGSYTEFISMIEVTYRGKKYDYALELVLENEGAIFMGREQLGVPKVIGKVVFQPTTQMTAPGFNLGHVERPAGNKIIQFSFRPVTKVHGLRELPGGIGHKNILALRIVPSPSASAVPYLREFVSIETFWTEGEVWTGVGSVNFLKTSDFDIAHKLPVVRYQESMLLRKASHHIAAELETFAIDVAA